LGLCVVSVKSEERSNKTIRAGESRGNEEANKTNQGEKKKALVLFWVCFSPARVV